jgi:hypothetical protein
MKSWKNNFAVLGVSLYFTIFSVGCLAMSETISSPDGKIKVVFSMDPKGRPIYSVVCAMVRAGEEMLAPVLKPSAMGLVRDDASFAEDLMLIKTSDVESVKDNYTMLLGKKRQCVYQANRRVFTLQNAEGYAMDIIFQVSNDGVAFRYAFNPTSDKTYTIVQENTAFAFADGTVSWLHPMQPGKTGWSQTQPSYEEYYELEQPVGKASPFGQGWCFPALFKTADGVWVLICDSDVTESYCAVRLAHDSTGGVYTIAFPHHDEHRGPVDLSTPQFQTPCASPWRVMMVGQTLNTVVESTLMTDVTTPCKLKKTDFIKPGKAAWHWLRYGDDSSDLTTAQSFLDFAAQMKWEYLLIDASWDRFIGYEKMAEFVKQARAKKVDVILWYNSNGWWNAAPMTPKNRMHKEAVRREEFAKLRQMGVKGVKIDFYGGDKQATMKLYIDTFKDAADFGILVNCHGTTIPRGWQRTYPNLVSMESVRGMEYCTFEQANADKEPQHCCILPFTRNAIGSMDYTPTVLDPKIRGVHLVTTPVFEIALPVVFESGVQHLGLVPNEMKLLTEEVKTYLQDVPTVWDETKLLDGYPAKYVVMARRSGKTWYIAGINGRNEKKNITINLSFAGAAKGTLITDGPDRTFVAKSIDTGKVEVEMSPHGGFVIIVR